MKKNEIKPFLSKLAIDAGKILLKYYDKKYKIEHKENAGIVTEADKAAEKFIVGKILRRFPGSSIVAEEGGDTTGNNELRWVIDPLDGTSNFAHKLPWFCVSIGLQMGETTVSGAIYQPVTRELYFAEKGKGAFLNGKRIRVSKTTAISNSLLGTGFYYAKGDGLRYDVEIFRRINEAALGVRRPGSAALDLAFVASGRYDGFWERGLSAWDVAAGYLIVTEAGGTVSDYQGKPTDIFSRQCVASNGKLHAPIIQLIEK